VDVPLSVLSIILALLLTLAALLAWRATHSNSSKFDFESAFIDPNGKTSMGRIGQFTALAVSTWAFVYLVANGDMTEWFFGLYMSAWVGNSLGNKWLEKKPDSINQGGDK
jgi:hypothetical protein